MAKPQDIAISLAGRSVHPELTHAYGAVKLACARTNHELGRWDQATFAAIEQAVTHCPLEPRVGAARHQLGETDLDALAHGFDVLCLQERGYGCGIRGFTH